MKKIFLLLFLVFTNIAWADPIIDPCASGVFALVNRPSPTGSACVIPNQEIMLEGGYQYFNLSGGAYGYITPQTEIRFGLPHDNELLIATPTFFHQTISPRAGWSAVTFSLKHEFGYNEHWLFAMEGLLTVPSGSESYGNRQFAGMINGIATYTYNPAFSVTWTLGVMSQSVQYINNGARFNSVNPDVVANWQLNDKWVLFGELNGQTRTGSGEGWGLIADGGIYYLPTPHVALDAELGQRVTGDWNFQNYAGVGFGWLFG